MNRKIPIRTQSHEYTAHVGQNILSDALEATLSSQRIDVLFVLIDDNVFEHHWPEIAMVLQAHTVQVLHMKVPEGEKSKSVEFWSEVMDFLLNNKVRRNSPLIVIGGGVTGDLGGFAAATALRGLPLIHIPTTLLAMVDSSIGGKTGVNHDAGKNLIGSFYQPETVIADTRFLDTLPEREWINGLSEILKYGAISDQNIFRQAEIFLKKDFKSADVIVLIELIATCIKIKAGIVEQDEFEGGIRAYLNFGHTFAHALEKASHYNTISHGEAVFLGMLAAKKLSELTGSNFAEDYLDKFRSLYTYRVSKENLSLDELTEHMHSDKKRTGKDLNFVLLKEWQHPVVKTVKDIQLIHQAWSAALNEL